MGNDINGENDEIPVHKVCITRPLYMGITEVTNAQYERFNPDHKALRGKNGFSLGDDEPVIYVSWNDAKAFCKWLTEKDGKPYRLPTEAEWEYCCRSGTQTAYFTGDKLDEVYFKAQTDKRELYPVDLTVKKTPANKFCLYDMHGNVEEWCEDWYAPYLSGEQVNPVGCMDGDFKVTRGGSHNTDVYYLRSAKRHAAVPEEKSCFIGFRVVQAEEVKTERYINKTEKQWQRDVSRQKNNPHIIDVPLFFGPINYINVPEDYKSIPIYSHNHCPSIAWCDNGDLLAIWFSCNKESGREMTILASRLRKGKSEWDMPDEFFKVPDRNMTGSSLYNNGRGTLFHFNGVSSAADWANLALVMRVSNDNGTSWSKPRFVNGEHEYRNQVISGTFETGSGYMIQPCDAHPSSNGGTAIHISYNGGLTWNNPAAKAPVHEFKSGNKGGLIAGIHAGVAELNDGSLLAFGRGDEIEGKLAQSISKDMGRTWEYMPSEFPPIGSGQRLILKRLREGPLLLISFTDSANYKFNSGSDEAKPKGIIAKNALGEEELVYGMFAALSYDEGKTWPVKKLISSGEARNCSGGAWTGDFYMDADHAEPMGYLAVTQSPDNIIHLVSSKLYYKFNLLWIEEKK